MRHCPDEIWTYCCPLSLIYEAQYSPPSLVVWETHSTVPVGFPPSHACTDLLLSSLPLFVFDVTNTPNDNTSLPPLEPHSPPRRFDSSDLYSSFFSKSKVTFHLPGDHGDGDVRRCVDDDRRGDDIDSWDTEDFARRFDDDDDDDIRPRSRVVGGVAHAPISPPAIRRDSAFARCHGLMMESRGRWIKQEVRRCGGIFGECDRGIRFVTQYASSGSIATEVANSRSHGAIIFIVFVKPSQSLAVEHPYHGR